MLAKWQGVQRRLDDEMVQLALCEGDPDRCASPAALQFLAIVDIARAREGRARLGEINRAINLAIRPMGDLAQYGEIDVWSSPLATLSRGAGRLRRLCDRQIHCVAAGRCSGRRSAHRDHARHHPRRGSCRCRRTAGWAMADAGQSPHGDGRGRQGQKLPAELRHRSRRRPTLRGGADAGARGSQLVSQVAAMPALQRRRCNRPGIFLFDLLNRQMQFAAFSDIAVRPECAWHFVWQKLWRTRIFSFAFRSTFD